MRRMLGPCFTTPVSRVLSFWCEGLPVITSNERVKGGMPIRIVQGGLVPGKSEPCHFFGMLIAD
jgi:hypothetical protein